jgi:hypothetical protein
MHIDLPSLNFTVERPVTLAGGHGATLRVLDGQVWLTEEDHLEDQFLVAGQSYTLQGLGRAVIESPSRAHIVIEAPVSVDSERALGSAVAEGWQRFAHWVHAVRSPANSPAFAK